MKLTPKQWLRCAQLLAAMLLFGTPMAAFFSLTVGLITGLIILIVPGYLFGAWLAMAGIVVSLCLWRQRPLLARILGGGATLGPAGAAVGSYAVALARCRHAPDPARCYEYINGSPLLPFFVGVCALVGLAAFGVVWVVAGAQRPSA